ncbi:hypothetical protein [Acetanaerobacterium elongatum]|nr:hypothetical protein [Acetanaerobacterium elongatum]
MRVKGILKAAAGLLAGAMLLGSCTGVNKQNPVPVGELLSSQAQGSSGQESKAAALSSGTNSAPVDLSDIEAVTKAYVAPLGDYCLCYPWASASEIQVNHLISICGDNNLLNRPADVNLNTPDPSAAEVEAALQRHFDVSADYLRTSWMYNKKAQTYHLYTHKQELPFRAISATQKGSRIEIEVGLTVPDPGKVEDKEATLLAGYAAVNYRPYGKDRLIFPSGTLTVELTGDNTVKYVSYKCSETFLKETEKLERYKKYAEAFEYDLGRSTWNDAAKLEPDALVVYYIYLCGTGEVDMPKNTPIEEYFGNPYMPAKELEAAVMKHLDVTPEQIRKSQYYDKKRNAYWTGGIGTTADTEIVSAKQEGNRLTLTMKDSITSSEAILRWNCQAVLEVDGDNYRYISYVKEETTKE